MDTAWNLKPTHVVPQPCGPAAALRFLTIAPSHLLMESANGNRVWMASPQFIKAHSMRLGQKAERHPHGLIFFQRLGAVFEKLAQYDAGVLDPLRHFLPFGPVHAHDIFEIKKLGPERNP